MYRLIYEILCIIGSQGHFLCTCNKFLYLRHRYICVIFFIYNIVILEIKYILQDVLNYWSVILHVKKIKICKLLFAYVSHLLSYFQRLSKGIVYLYLLIRKHGYKLNYIYKAFLIAKALSSMKKKKKTARVYGMNFLSYFQRLLKGILHIYLFIRKHNQILSTFTRYFRLLVFYLA